MVDEAFMLNLSTLLKNFCRKTINSIRRFPLQGRISNRNYIAIWISYGKMPGSGMLGLGDRPIRDRRGRIACPLIG
ncbi:MAG: hypothetical protein WBG37_13325 [Desulfobacterales bacterium]